MKERINELAKQAGIELFEDKAFKWHIIAGTDHHLSKFAELIVRECMNTIINTNPENEIIEEDTYLDGFHEARQLIYFLVRKHFGVKE